MLNDIKNLSNQIVEFLKDKEGFSTNVQYEGVILDVTNPKGDMTSYDCYELLLYTLAVRKLGSDIDLNIHTDENGDKIFAINTEAQLDINAEMFKINESFVGFKHDTIQSVFIGRQTTDSKYPYCVMTLYKNGNWVRYDLVLAEVLYAFSHGLKLELDDSSYVYKKLRTISTDIQTQLKLL